MEPSSTNYPRASFFLKLLFVSVKCGVELYLIDSSESVRCLIIRYFLSSTLSIGLSGQKRPKEIRGSGKRTLVRNVGGYSKGVHLFPFRTEKLSPLAPMVLPQGGRVGRCQPNIQPTKPRCHIAQRGF